MSASSNSSCQFLYSHVPNVFSVTLVNINSHTKVAMHFSKELTQTTKLSKQSAKARHSNNTNNAKQYLPPPGRETSI